MATYGGPSYMDTDQQHNSVSSSTDEYTTRPNFVNKDKLKKLYSCTLCKDILVQPHQISCGYRVCKTCIDEKFGDKAVIPCPMPHDDLDEVELAEEPCQLNGLHHDRIVQDSASHRVLLKEKCFCRNQPFGCCDKPIWKKLKEHQSSCQFTPLPCKNQGCPERFAVETLLRHQEECPFAIEPCRYCGQHIRRKDLEDHYGECERADSQCNTCGKRFDKRRQLLVHQRTHAPCITEAGNCFYHDYCHFETDSVQRLQKHVQQETDLHLEAVTAKMNELDQVVMKGKELYSTEAFVRRVVNKKVKSLEKVIAQIAMNVQKLKDRQESSETNGEHLVNAMRTVAHSSQQIGQVTSRVAVIERQIKDSGLDRVTVIESHSQTIRRHNELLNDMEKRMKNTEFTSFDGTLIWRIADYKRKKADAVRGRQMSIYSYPFYTSRFGYKMCCRAYLNGDGLGRGQCLSLFLVMMRGEFDKFLTYPFKRRVTFSLLCPSNCNNNKHETFLPDPDSSSFQRPQTEMNIASGCPQFALHSEVESSSFLVSDSIYIRVKVEPGWDVIP